MATPTLVQKMSYQNMQGNGVTKYSMRFPNTVLSGNAVIVATNQNGGTSDPSSVVMGSDTFTKLGSVNHASGQKITLWYCLNITDTPRVVEVNFGSSTTFVAAQAFEFYNISTSNASFQFTSGSGASAGTLSTTAFTPAANDLVLCLGVQDGSLATMVSWTAGSGFALMTSDTLDGIAAQFQVSAGGSTTPTMAQSPNNTWVMAAGAFTAATQGTAPTGAYCAGMQHLRAQAGEGAPCVVPFPSNLGNALEAKWVGAGEKDCSGVTLSVNGAMTQAGTVSKLTGSGSVQIFYKLNTTPTTTETVSFGWDGVGTILDTLIILSEFVNVKTSQTPAENKATGTDVSGTISGATLTPATAGGVVSSIVGITTNFVTANATGNWTGGSSFATVATSPIDENQGATLYKNVDNSTVLQNVYTITGGAAGAWADKMVAYEPVASTPAPTLSSISPVAGAQGATVTVTFTGTNFDQANLAVQVSGANVTPGSPASITATTFTSSFVIGASAALTARNVTASTDGGTTGAKTFTVTAPSNSAITINDYRRFVRWRHWFIPVTSLVLVVGGLVRGAINKF